MIACSGLKQAWCSSSVRICVKLDFWRVLLKVCVCRLVWIYTVIRSSWSKPCWSPDSTLTSYRCCDISVILLADHIISCLKFQADLKSIAWIKNALQSVVLVHDFLCTSLYWPQHRNKNCIWTKHNFCKDAHLFTKFMNFIRWKEAQWPKVEDFGQRICRIVQKAALCFCTAPLSTGKHTAITGYGVTEMMHNKTKKIFVMWNKH